MLRFRAARDCDAATLAARLREPDRDEIRAAVGRDAGPVLAEGVASSQPCWAVLAGDGDLIALFGVVPDCVVPRRGMVWLLSTNDLPAHSIAVLRASRAWVDKLHEDYDYLWNHIDARNAAHLNWLRWCGFSLVERIERHGFEQRPFWRFERCLGNGATARSCV